MQKKTDNLDSYQPEVLDASLVTLLLEWYDKGHRDLPWRKNATPYHVWLSEIMLQQTRVEAVKGYYDRFLLEIPDIGALADAQEERLLKLWEGLGYYSRVRNLQKAAQVIMAEYDGQMPCKKEDLLRLPGIGSYTAGAISSICFNEPNPAVDGNVLRILSRVRADSRDILNGKVKKAIEDELTQLMPKGRCGDFNQAMMELGAMVCVPNGAPHCEACPWNSCCKVKTLGSYRDYPVKNKETKRRIEQKTILLLMDEEKIAIHKRPEKGLLAGLYEYPSYEGFLTQKELLKSLSRQGIKTIRIEKICDAKHIFSHIEWHMQGYLVRVDELEPNIPFGEAKDWQYVRLEEIINQYPIPSAFEKYSSFLRNILRF